MKNFLVLLFFIALTSASLGDYLFGVNLGMNVVTLVVLVLGLFLLTMKVETYFVRIFLYFLIFVLLQTFIYNYDNIEFISSFKHFGIFIFTSFCIFRFTSLFIDDLEKLFNILINLSIITILIGYIQIVLYTTQGITFKPQDMISGLNSYSFESEIINLIPRPTSIFSEPAHFSTFLLPSALISLNKLIDRKCVFNISNFKAVFILFGFVSTFSLVGYFGIFLYIVYYISRNKVMTFNSRMSISLVLLISLYTLFNSSLSQKLFSFKNQISDPTSFEFSQSDLSGFALLSNTFVSFNSLKSSGYLGSGFNSHKLSYDKYISQFFNEDQIIMELNRDDAGSLYLRLISELGLPGLLFFLFFLYKFKLTITDKNMYSFINEISFVILIFYGFRQGSYMNVFFIFFASVYYLTSKIYLVNNKKKL